MDILRLKIVMVLLDLDMHGTDSEDWFTWDCWHVYSVGSEAIIWALFSYHARLEFDMTKQLGLTEYPNPWLCNYNMFSRHSSLLFRNSVTNFSTAIGLCRSFKGPSKHSSATTPHLNWSLSHEIAASVNEIFSVNVLGVCICAVLCWTGLRIKSAVLHYKAESCIPNEICSSNMQPLVLCFTLYY
jgi:hypothetical protein